MNRLEELRIFFNLPTNYSEVEMYQAARKLFVQYHPDMPDGDIGKYNEARKNFDELVNLENNSISNSTNSSV